jgi:hypothetical protein
MAGPFGGHPTLQTYLDWLRRKGFRYKTGYVDLADRPVSLVTVQDAAGKDVFNIGDMPMGERLAPSQVSYFDSIFGVDSPFSKTPR